MKQQTSIPLSACAGSASARSGSRTSGLTLLLAAALASMSCASAPSAAPEDLVFAPSLNVDLSAMERLPSGVYVRDLRAGTGAEVRAGQQLAVHYVGWLPDGTQFDATAPPSPPVEFTLGNGEVIRGWDRGLPGMRVGGQRMLVVPAALGYGRQRTSAVPPNSVLVFVIEVVRAR
jgi:FKBP-type peptidyl-prolyl cis-trans isomerase FkpA